MVNLISDPYDGGPGLGFCWCFGWASACLTNPGCDSVLKEMNVKIIIFGIFCFYFYFWLRGSGCSLIIIIILGLIIIIIIIIFGSFGLVS